PGFKFAEHELKGVPVRIGIGARDLEQGVAEVARRDTKEKESIPLENLPQRIKSLLEEIQANLFRRAQEFRDLNTHYVDNRSRFEEIISGPGGFVYAHWDGTSESEEAIKEATKATIRCIPMEAADEDGKCIWTGAPSRKRVLFAKAY